ncbi:DUF333 domain-containing protein [Brenneria izadpanahii]|uniref:DUF333 domain-containing protein n=1 Tax=Brenneria izadpanahii TaxID=2722756 RepID=A0ABX7UPS1_9GAMM|nr:DUF333 domain-containing protein [Brenneria izadpanahii]QTF07688.1 DUF333 domain-containing protein [Brenneria izadpanahii]
MKLVIACAGVFLSVLAVAGCSTRNNGGAPKSVGMPNPASVYCQGKGGKLEMVSTDNGTVGYCLLPNGERIEEWTLYRRDNKNR